MLGEMPAPTEIHVCQAIMFDETGNQRPALRMRASQVTVLVEIKLVDVTSNQIGGSSLSGRATVSRSIPVTWFTPYSGDIGNTFAWKGLSMLSTIRN